MRPLVARSHRICNSVTGEVAVAVDAAAVAEFARLVIAAVIFMVGPSELLRQRNG